ncbi:MAG: hypothetical protein D4R41_02800 [Sediminibacterium sp.]|nr:MAG: hypothetical protein D4R41_02800 [Sediminibacterium sp.]
MKFLVNWLQRKTKEYASSGISYSLEAKLSFETIFFVHYEKEQRSPIIREFNGNTWHKDAIYPIGHCFKIKIFVRNVHELKGETVTLSIYKYNEEVPLVTKTFKVPKNIASATWFELQYMV